MSDKLIPTVSFLYKILKINGMAPFSYSSKRKLVYLSSISTMRSVCTGILIIGISLFCDMQLSKGYVPYQGKAIEYLVGYILFYYNFIKIVITIFIQLVHREEFVRLVNQLSTIKSKFERFVQMERFQDQKLLNQLRNRRILAGIQVFTIISSISCYIYRTLYLNNYLLMIFCYVAVVYMNLYSILMTTIYYNGAMILVDRFYRLLISRLKFLLLVKRKVMPEPI